MVDQAFDLAAGILVKLVDGCPIVTPQKQFDLGRSDEESLGDSVKPCLILWAWLRGGLIVTCPPQATEIV